MNSKVVRAQHAPSIESAADFREEYAASVNPNWLRLLNVLQMDVSYTSCLGAELFTASGRRILDFLSGYCVHNLGHNHPALIASVIGELERRGPAMLQSHIPEQAGQLAHRLCQASGGQVSKAFFCSSGSEGIEAAIKFARMHTGRTGLLYADGAFHGLTCGALSLMGNDFWKRGFGPLLPDADAIPFDSLPQLEERLKTRRYAALVLEPIQGEAGIRLPSPNYLSAAHALCRQHGTLLVLDEVQTGFCRTGPFLAAHHYGVEPEIVVLAKAMSGGLVPSAAVLMTDEIYQSVYGSLRRSLIHTSTYSENGLAMRVGLAVLDTLQDENAGERSTRLGEYMRERLRAELRGLEMVEEVRGAGLFTGIALKPPRGIGLRLSFEAFKAIHPAMFGQVLVMRLFNDCGILTQICGNNFSVLKLAPPLIVSEHQIDEAVAGVRRVLEMAHSQGAFWAEALGMARRVVNL